MQLHLVPAGFIQPEQLQKYIDVANEFGAVLKLTGSQRIMITNLKAEDVDKAWEMLGMDTGSVCSRSCGWWYKGVCRLGFSR